MTNHSVIASYGILTLDGAKVESITGAAAVKAEEGSVLNITGGTEVKARDLGVTTFGTTTVDGKSTITSGNKAFNAFVWSAYSSTLNINEATVTGGIGVGGASVPSGTHSINVGEKAVLNNFEIKQHEDYAAKDYTTDVNSNVAINPNATINLADNYVVAAGSAFKAGLTASDLGVSPDGTVKAVADATADVLTAAKAKVEAFLTTYKIASGDNEAAIEIKLKNEVIDAGDDAGRLGGVTVAVIGVSDKVAPTTETDGSWTVNITLTENGTNARINNVELTIPRTLNDTEQYDALVKAVADKIAEIEADTNIENDTTDAVFGTPLTNLNADYTKVQVGSVTVATTNATADEAGKKTITVTIDTKNESGGWVKDSTDDPTPYEVTIKSDNARIDEVKVAVGAVVDQAMATLEAAGGTKPADFDTNLESGINAILTAANNGVTLDGSHKSVSYTAAAAGGNPAKVTADVKLTYGSNGANAVFDQEKEIADNSDKLDDAEEAIKPLLKAQAVTNETVDDDLTELNTAVSEAIAGILGVTADPAHVDIQDEATEDSTGLAMLTVTLSVSGSPDRPVTVGVIIPKTTEENGDQAKIDSVKPLVNAYLSALSVTKESDEAAISEAVNALDGVAGVAEVTVTITIEGESAAVKAVIKSGETTDDTLPALTKPVTAAGSGIKGDADQNGIIDELDVVAVVEAMEAIMQQ